MGKFDLHFIWNEAVTDAPCAARTNIGYDPEAAFRIAVNAVIEGCAYVAEQACLVPPDGGEPSPEEVEVAAEAARRIRALKS